MWLETSFYLHLTIFPHVSYDIAAECWGSYIIMSPITKLGAQYSGILNLQIMGSSQSNSELYWHRLPTLLPGSHEPPSNAPRRHGMYVCIK